MLTEVMLPILLAINLLHSFAITGDPVSGEIVKCLPQTTYLSIQNKHHLTHQRDLPVASACKQESNLITLKPHLLLSAFKK